ncbi:MAG: hypothetical protein M3P31_00270 [Actinomycetota bacterium]|nr:hypothetical protein [Actinomycetota bacterium]MDP9465674.1 hypothetical protein [Actinomycetota bacterium]
MTDENTDGQAANAAGLSAQPDPAADLGPDPAETEVFDREYVQKLRDEAAGHRVRAKRTDALNARLATAQAALTGKLADPTDLPFTDDLLDDDGLVDEAKVHAAVDDLIKRKPHLAARRPTGNVGQGARPELPEIGLAAMLRRGA